MNQVLLSRMLMVSAIYHEEQYDKGGNPYALHPLAVMNLLDPEHADEELKCIALGHDLLEDTHLEYETILESFGYRIAEGIQAMTRKDGMSYDAYIGFLMENPDAVRVKMADLRHNSDFTRLKGISEKDIARMSKYMKTYAKLKDALEQWDADNE